MTTQNNRQAVAHQIRGHEEKVDHLENEIERSESDPDLVGVKDQIHKLRQDDELKKRKKAAQERESELGIPGLNLQKRSIEQSHRLPELRKAKREEERKIPPLQRRLVDLNL